MEPVVFQKTFGAAEYAELSLPAYRSFWIRNLYSLILPVFIFVLAILGGEVPGYVVAMMFFLAAVQLALAIMQRYNTKVAYKRFTMSEGENELLYTVTMGEQIEVFNSVHPAPISYNYNQVRKLIITKKQIMLGLELNLFLPFALEDEEKLREILREKCKDAPKKCKLIHVDERAVPLAFLTILPFLGSAIALAILYL